MLRTPSVLALSAVFLFMTSAARPAQAAAADMGGTEFTPSGSLGQAARHTLKPDGAEKAKQKGKREKLRVFVSVPPERGGYYNPDILESEKDLKNSLHSHWSVFIDGLWPSELFEVTDSRDNADIVLVFLGRGWGSDSLRQAGDHTTSIPSNYYWFFTDFETIDHHLFYTAATSQLNWQGLAHMTVEGLMKHTLANYDHILALRQSHCSEPGNSHIFGRCAETSHAKSITAQAENAPPCPAVPVCRQLENAALAQTPAVAGVQTGTAAGVRDVQQEIANIRDGRNEPMPPAQAAPANLGGQTGIVVENGTSYALSVFISGPSSHNIQIAPGDFQSIALSPGDYEIAASVSNTGVLPFYGKELFGSNMRYSEKFYVTSK